MTLPSRFCFVAGFTTAAIFGAVRTLAAADIGPLPMSKNSDPAALNPLMQVSISDAAAFLDKPLFSPSRKPFAPVVMPQFVTSAPLAVVPTVDHLELIGTIQTLQEISAQIKDDRTGITASLMKGDVVGDWTVTRIDGAMVELKQKGHMARLELFKKKDRPEARSASTTPILPLPQADASSVPKDNHPAAGTIPILTEPTISGSRTAAAEAIANSTAKLVFGTENSSSSVTVKIPK